MQTKQIIVIRKDLKCRRGKEISQGCHASMKWLVEKWKKSDFALTKEQEEWLYGSSAKICLQVDTEIEIMNLCNKAVELGLTAHLIVDSGKTEFGGIPTTTCCAIGPNESSKIDQVTGYLKLY